MSRRDTIIVAALINAGLLIVLFVSALKNQEEGEKTVLHKESSDFVSNEVIAVAQPKKILGDEVDVVLKQYMQQDPLQVPVAAIPVSTASNFVDDLQGLTQQTSQSSASIPVATQVFSKKEESLAWIEVKVKKGDMLEKLARQHHTSVSEIMKLNNLASTQLKIGQVLKIASSKEATPKAIAKAEAIVLDATPSKFYTVKTGDSPWTIAVKNHMKVEELLKLNAMNEEKARKLKPGDQIRIR